MACHLQYHRKKLRQGICCHIDTKSVYRNIKTGSRQRLHLRNKESLRDGNNTLGELFLQDSFQTGTANLPETAVIVLRNSL